MLKLKDGLIKYEVNCYEDLNGWDLTYNEIKEYIDNLTLEDLKIGDFNYFDFIKYDEVIEVFVYEDIYHKLIFNIEEVF